MGLLSKLMGKKPESAPKREECVLVYLDGASLSDEIYQNYDLSTLEEQLIEAITGNGVGEFDGNEVGPEATTLYAYGSDADALFSAMEPVLRSYPLCQKARVVIRKGPPGSPQAEIQL
jgi:hypothetical protein